MLNSKFLAAVPLIGLLAACGNSGASYVPVVDGPVGPTFNGDLAACQQLASQQGALAPGTATTAATGAAVAGGATALISNQGNNVRDAAIVGAAAGLASGALQQERNKEAIIRNCMRGRGHNVVG
ncbi:MAG: glycine zipper family protein [Pseudomonadota bacterium]